MCWRVVEPILRAILWVGVLAGVDACSTHTRQLYDVVSGHRDWSSHPAVLELDPVPGDVYAMSDIHGGYDRMLALLAQNGLIAPGPTAPAELTWVGGNAVLIVVGDMVDKGPKSVEVVDALRGLENAAAAAGGKVVVTVGNHEAEFFYDPANDKTAKGDGFRAEMESLGIDPIAVASGADPRGQWLRDLPFAIHAGKWFFAHAGNTAGRSIPDLEAALRSAIDLNPAYDGPETVGGNSILESKDWYGARLGNAQSLGVQHIVFGHQPTAVGPSGKIALTADGVLFRIDCGMSPDVNYSAGRLLRLRTDAGKEVAQSLDPTGAVEVLWRSP